MKFTVTLDRDEDGVWVIECPAIPGCVSQGQTREEAIENIKDAIKLALEVRAERGMPLTIETRSSSSRLPCCRSGVDWSSRPAIAASGKTYTIEEARNLVGNCEPG